VPSRSASCARSALLHMLRPSSSGSTPGTGGSVGGGFATRGRAFLTRSRSLSASSPAGPLAARLRALREAPPTPPSKRTLALAPPTPTSDSSSLQQQQQQLQPDPSPQPQPLLLGRRGPEHIIVKEADFKRCGHDLAQLRAHDVRRRSCVEDGGEQSAVDAMSPAPSFKTAYARKCRQSDGDVRDPWESLQNPEFLRATCENDLVLNQVWESAAPKLYKTVGLTDEEKQQATSAPRLQGTSSSRRRKSVVVDHLQVDSLSRSGRKQGRPSSSSSSSSRASRVQQQQQRAGPRIVEVDAGEHDVDVAGGGDDPDAVDQLPGSRAVRDAIKAERHGLRPLAADRFHFGLEARAAWLVLEPSSGEVAAYPKAVAERLEAAYQVRASVPLVGLGKGVNNVVVTFCPGNRTFGFEESSTSAAHVAREVLRLSVPVMQLEFEVAVARRGRRWSFARQIPPSLAVNKTSGEELSGPLSPAALRSGGLVGGGDAAGGVRSDSSEAATAAPPEASRSAAAIEGRKVVLVLGEVVEPQRLPPSSDRQQRVVTTFLNTGTELWG